MLNFASDPGRLPACGARENTYAHNVARHAVRSLHDELVLYPKPGLVSLVDNGAHRDMDATTFMRSLFSLRRFFETVTIAGARAAPMAELRALGLAAEARMLCATGGINTHRGAIFALGLLCAAAGRAHAEGRAPTDSTLRNILATHWRRDMIAVATSSDIASHGRQMAARYGASGARGEAIGGFPSVFEVALPALRDACRRGADARSAGVHAFFSLLAVVEDTNVLYRAGRSGHARLRDEAASFLAQGGVFAPGWLPRAIDLHRRCSRANLSPGGCADLYAAASLVHHLQA